MANVRFWSVQRFGRVTDVLSAKESAEGQSIEEISGGDETGNGTEAEVSLELEKRGYVGYLRYGVTIVVAMFFHEMHRFLSYTKVNDKD